VLDRPVRVEPVPLHQAIGDAGKELARLGVGPC
jgi:hypothetical protein